MQIGKEECSELPTTLKWFCIVFMRIYYKFNLPKSAILTILVLLSVVLKITGHPCYEMFPTTMHGLLNIVSASKFNRTVYVVCPNDKCNQLYMPAEAQKLKNCTDVSFGKACQSELGYYRKLAFGKTKWTPHKTYHFVSPSDWLKHMFRNEAFCELLHEGCNRSSTEGLLGDVKDGNVWKTFCDPLDATKTFFLIQITLVYS